MPAPSPPSPRRPFLNPWRAVALVALAAAVAAVAIGPRRLRLALADGSSCPSLPEQRTGLSALRAAVELYAQEHGGSYPAPAAGVTVADLLTRYSDADGTATSATKDPAAGVVLGPYLRSVPAVAAGPYKGATGIAAAHGPGVGWVYDPATGRVEPNLEQPAGDPRPR
ncbi:MAG TPA: hypothetical protein VF796_18505 [Humisphaera sp.]